MSNEITRSISVIATEINAIKTQTSGVLTAAFAYAKRSCFEIGKRLEEAKSLVPHGEWGSWLEVNFEYSESTAGNLMRIYREYGDEQINVLTGKSDAETFEGLSQSQLVELFALPKAMRADFVEEHRAELEGGDMSVRELRETIKSLKDTIEKQDEAIRENDESYAELVEKLRTAEKERDDFEDQAEKAEQTALDREKDFDDLVKQTTILKSELDELKNTPREIEEKTVTVNEPTEEQIEEIRSAALKDAKDDYEKQLEEAEEEYKKQLEEKENAHERAIKELEEETQKKIRGLTAKSDPHASRITYCLEAINRAINDINNEISSMDKENPGSGSKMRMKCESTLLGIINRAGWQV